MKRGDVLATFLWLRCRVQVFRRDRLGSRLRADVLGLIPRRLS